MDIDDTITNYILLINDSADANEWTSWQFITTCVMTGFNLILLIIGMLINPPQRFRKTPFIKLSNGWNRMFTITKSFYGITLLVVATAITAKSQYAIDSNFISGPFSSFDYTTQLEQWKSTYIGNSCDFNGKHDINLCFCQDGPLTSPLCSPQMCSKETLGCTQIIDYTCDCDASFYEFTCSCGYNDPNQLCNVTTSVEMTQTIQPAILDRFQTCFSPYLITSKLVWTSFFLFLSNALFNLLSLICLDICQVQSILFRRLLKIVQGK